jgi:threonine/homoserine/homoserine lactone efflux protein
MALVTNLPAFLLAVVVITATPGPAVALIVRRTALRGLSYGLATVVGLEIGLYTWALLVASGFAVVAASEFGYAVLKVIGCLVLGWLAIRSFRSWWIERREPSLSKLGQSMGDNHDAGRERSWFWAVGEGFVVQLANPKAAVFLLALYPQFVPRDQPLFQSTAILGVLQVLIETALYGSLAVGVTRASSWFRTSAVRRRMEALTGTVLVALGVRLALSGDPA